MTDRPPQTERRRINIVAILATMLFGLLLGAVAWLLFTDAPESRVASAPAAVISVPEFTMPISPPPPVAEAAKPEAAPAAELEAAPTPEPAPAAPPAIAEASAPLPEPMAEPMAEPTVEPPALPPPVAETSPPTIPIPPPPVAEAAPEPQPPTAPPAAPEVAIAIPAPPVYQPDQRGEPAPAPDGLLPAPDPNLVEDSRDGPLPRIGKDGRKPWQVYARPFDVNDKRPRIALIISGLGQSTSGTDAAIQRLPGAVTLAFAPYAKNLDQWIAAARAAGHEALLTIPMEPLGYPENDPGPHTLLTTISDRDNRDRLLFLLSRFPGYVGVLNTMGARMTTAPQNLRPILEELRDRGLIFVDSRSSLRSVAASQATEIGLPRAINNRFIDIKASRQEIDQRLEELERIARESGAALGIGSPYPVTIERVALWVQELESKGLVLAPVSAVVDKQPD